VEFLAEEALRGFMRFAEAIVKRTIARQLAQYHANLRRNIEAGSASRGGDTGGAKGPR
jgi:hypothetical protein